MDGVHDMGGMHGFGEIEREEEEPLFHEPWEARVLGICRGTPVPIPGGMRNNIERLDPAFYLGSSYYEKWLHARIKGLIDAGTISEAELETEIARYRENPERPIPESEEEDSAKVRIKWTADRHSGGTVPVPLEPIYSVGDRVRAVNLHPEGHTRLPRYIRRKVGEVTRIYGAQEFQDAEAIDGRSGAMPVYAVRFDSKEVWGESGEANSSVTLDMWEAYLASEN